LKQNPTLTSQISLADEELQLLLSGTLIQPAPNAVISVPLELQKYHSALGLLKEFWTNP